MLLRLRLLPALRAARLLACAASALTAYAQGRPTQGSAARQQILAVEQAFETALNAHGAAFAFEQFAAPDAVIKRRDDSLIVGARQIGRYYANVAYQRARAHWKPDVVEVSGDGTLAYTYGRYRWEFTDPAGKVTEYRGVFHTVWKRQPDGTWKYVWD